MNLCLLWLSAVDLRNALRTRNLTTTTMTMMTMTITMTVTMMRRVCVNRA